MAMTVPGSATDRYSLSIIGDPIRPLTLEANIAVLRENWVNVLQNEAPDKL